MDEPVICLKEPKEFYAMAVDAHMVQSIFRTRSHYLLEARRLYQAGKQTV